MLFLKKSALNDNLKSKILFAMVINSRLLYIYFLSFFSKKAKRFIEQLHENLKTLNKTYSINTNEFSNKSEDLLEFDKNGIIVKKINKNFTKEIKSNLSAEIATLINNQEVKLSQNLKPSHSDINIYLDRSSYNNIYEQAFALIEESGINNLISFYQKPKLSKIYLQVNDRAYSEAQYGKIGLYGLPEQNVNSYFHIDSKCNSFFKVLIYLDPVSREDGPFRFSTKSHKLMSLKEMAIRKTFGSASWRKFSSLVFHSFPINLNFSKELTNNPKTSLYLRNNEKVITSDSPIVILFNFNGIHRGAFVRGNKKRIMLQCLYKSY